MAHSAVLVSKDGINPRVICHQDRLRYLELQRALNFKRNLMVYDIGANIGEVASFLAKLPLVDQIYCFEPAPHVYTQLIRNTRDKKKIHCFPVALGEQNAMTKMHISEFSACSSLLPMDSLHEEEFPFSKNTSEGQVRIMTLVEAVKTYHLPAPDFIKIDVQGFEDRVIHGGEEIIKEAGFCLLELSLVHMYQGDSLITEMNRLMRDLGFRLTNIIGTIRGESSEILQIDGLYKNDSILV
jgi:FkbM family methyltransferase